MKIRHITALALLLASAALAADKDARMTAKFQVTGLFDKGRVADLREVMKAIGKVELVSIDYDNAEVSIRFVPKEAFPGAGKPEQVVQQFNDKVRGASSHTFGIKAARAPGGKLKWVEIAVAGCHCKACDLAAYEIVQRVAGVEQAQASFREGRVRALIDPAKVDRGKLMAELKRRGVDVKGP